MRSSHAGSGDSARAAAAALLVKRRSSAFFAFFGFIFERALRRDFNALRIATSGMPPAAATPRLIIYTNHPSWWDAPVYVFLSRHFFAHRPLFSPMEATMLQRYPFMARIGAFGVERHGVRGAIDFLANCKAILSAKENFLVVACQGRFADIRERPLDLERGIAHLADLAAGTTFLPLAIEYTFWDERRPELLLRFGAPIAGDTLATLPIGERLLRLEHALEDSMTSLSILAVKREASAFTTMLAGAKGVNVFYDGWRRIKAAFSGQRFDPSHGDGL